MITESNLCIFVYFKKKTKNVSEHYRIISLIVICMLMMFNDVLLEIDDPTSIAFHIAHIIIMR